MFWRKTNIFIFCCLFFILGIALASFVQNLSISAFSCFIFLNILLVFLAVFWRWMFFRIIILLFVFLLLGYFRYLVVAPEITNSQISFYNNEEVVIQARIINEVEMVESRQSFVVETYVLNQRKLITGRVLIRTGAYPGYHYGDVLSIDCLLVAPEEFDGFAYDRFLAKDNIYSICRYGEIEYLGNKGSNFYNNLLLFKDKIRAKINLYLPEPAASLLKAIILGDKKQIRDDLRENFSRVGISHIMAISGMHIAIIYGMVIYFSLLIGLWRKQAFVVATFSLFLYIILIGMPTSAVRAGVMMGFLMFAMYLGRLNCSLNALLIAACVLLFNNPYLLRDDLGFQLSFFAVLGIIYVFPVLKNTFTDSKNIYLRKGLDIILVTISAQVLTWPLIVYHFSIISTVSLFANLLIIPILPILMSLAIFALLVAFVLPIIASSFFLPVELIFNYILWVSSVFESVPGSYFEKQVSIFGVIAYYFLVVLFLFFNRKKFS